MTRRWLAVLPVALVLAGSAVLPAVARADDPIVNCTRDTQELTDLTSALTDYDNALHAMPFDPTMISQASGDLFHAILAAQRADCLPPLPTLPPPSTDPTSPIARAAAPLGGNGCAADTVRFMSAVLSEIAASTASTPNSKTIFKAAAGVSSAIAAIDKDRCLPVNVPVPTAPVS